MYPLCYFVMTVNLNKWLMSILGEVNINGYNTCILSIIGAAYLYIWGQLNHMIQKLRLPTSFQKCSVHMPKPHQ